LNPAPAPLEAPVIRLGRYRLLLELGQGGMARVYVAFSSGLGGFNKLVVLKVMRDELRDNDGSLAMFLAEARLAARMNHPNIVQTLEVGEDDGRYFICMEYLEGQTLGRLLRKTSDKPLPLAARLELICQVLEALGYMHGFTNPDGTPLGLVHRDISPNNIFITFDGSAKVLDFGVAKATGVSHATEAGMFKGKLGYAAPEQLVGDSEQRSDVFAIGVLLWETLTYRRFSQDRTQQEVVQARVAGVDPELMRKALGVPVELLQICMRAAAKEPRDRYTSALEMRDALRAYIKQNKLEYSPELLRVLMDELYSSERTEIRRLIDQRMKQASVEDDHPDDGLRAIPAAPALLGGLGAVTLTGNAFVPISAPANKGKWILALVGVALAAGISGWLLSGSNQTQGRSTVGSSSTTPSLPGAQKTDSGAAAKLVTVKIAASPTDAEILLDGAKLDGNPFAGQFPKDPALHRLEVRSLGRRTEARMISLDQNLDLLIALEPDVTRPSKALAPVGLLAPAKPGPSAKHTSDAPPAPSSTTGTLSHKSHSDSARPIDDADPYAN
jgi:serine/threonine-protein kinase